MRYCACWPVFEADCEGGEADMTNPLRTRGLDEAPAIGHSDMPDALGAGSCLVDLRHGNPAVQMGVLPSSSICPALWAGDFFLLSHG